MGTNGHKHMIGAHTMDMASTEGTRGAEMPKGGHATHTTRTQGVGHKAGLGLVAGVTMAGMLASPGIAMASEVDATPDATQPQVQATNAANPIEQAQQAVTAAQDGLNAAQQNMQQAQSTVDGAQAGVQAATNEVQAAQDNLDAAVNADPATNAAQGALAEANTHLGNAADRLDDAVAAQQAAQAQQATAQQAQQAAQQDADAAAQAVAGQQTVVDGLEGSWRIRQPVRFRMVTGRPDTPHGISSCSLASPVNRKHAYPS